MPQYLINVVIIFNLVRCLPHLVVFCFHHNKQIIKADILRWLNLLRKNFSLYFGFIYLLAFYPEFRNLFYVRIGNSKYLLNILCPKLSTLFIATKDIGEGLFIQHGFATAIGAKSIGKNCWINQQVTIGHNNGCPTILDNVTIRSGAVIIGNITIGNNSIIGANTTVSRDIPDNCTVFPAPLRIMKWNDNNTQTQLDDIIKKQDEGNI